MFNYDTYGEITRDSTENTPFHPLLTSKLTKKDLSIYVTRILFHIKLTKNITKGWSDLDVNTQIDKDLKP